MNDTPLIHVVDDDDSLRNALVRQLKGSGFDAQAYASTGEFLLHDPPQRPGCVLLDLRLPGPSGLDLQAALPGKGITLPVVFMTGHPDMACTVRAMKAGAVDFLEKPIEREALFDAVARALSRDARQRAARAQQRNLRERFALLSAREKEVFDRVVAGKLNKQIADELGIAERTVKAMRAQLMDKLGVGSAGEMGVLAERLRHLQEA
jgi:FixJ family two-component response regulator